MGRKKPDPGPPTTEANNIRVTQKEISSAFEEWNRRYRQNPDGFMNDSEAFCGPLNHYGDKCAEFLIDIIKKNRQI